MKKKKFLFGFLVMAITSLIIAFILDISLLNKEESETDDITETVLETSVKDKSNIEENIKQETIPVFSSRELAEININRINGVSWKPEAPVRIEELRYIEVTYWGFDDKTHLGELVVHKDVSDEVLEIFKELYETKFPIDKIRLIDEYNADDDSSMDDNNTSSFNFRVVAGTDKLSKHSYGLAIDINPVQNPYIKGDTVSPQKGKEYVDRSDIRKGMIIKGDTCYNAFINRGWIWGGEWKTMKDYQHFQKDILLNNN